MATQAAISLAELQENIKQTLDAGLKQSYWITAEINEMKVNQAGHCYLMLVEKDADSAMLKAKVAATIWDRSFRLLRAYFEDSTGQKLTSGLKIMVKVLVQYHTLYGLSLNITDVEPAYTVGSMALQRRNTIAKLEADGVFEMNHELPLPTLPQRVAVISSEQAAGYQDFVQHLHDNEYGFGFSLTLFPSLMQGEKAVQDIMDALDRINTHKDAFDVVVIIRGGGATADLLCFDDYALASYVAQFPLPILTGIGHNKDESVVDMVAHQSLKTPTAVADFLVDQLTEEAAALDTYSNEISGIMQEILTRETRGLAVWQQQLISATTQRLQQENFALQLFAQSIESYHPYHILARGYAVARFRGKALTQASAVHPGDEVEVVLHKGNIHTVVQG